MHDSPIRLLRFETATEYEPAIDRWFDAQPPDLGGLARPWFDCMRSLGSDVRELLHDGHPTACVGDAAFAYVNVFTAHVNVGFFLGAWLNDPSRLLKGTGKRMRHVKLKPGQVPCADDLTMLIENAYHDMHKRLSAIDRDRPN